MQHDMIGTGYPVALCHFFNNISSWFETSRPGVILRNFSTPEAPFLQWKMTPDWELAPWWWKRGFRVRPSNHSLCQNFKCSKKSSEQYQHTSLQQAACFEVSLMSREQMVKDKLQV